MTTPTARNRPKIFSPCLSRSTGSCRSGSMAAMTDATTAANAPMRRKCMLGLPPDGDVVGVEGDEVVQQPDEVEQARAVLVGRVLRLKLEADVREQAAEVEQPRPGVGEDEEDRQPVGRIVRRELPVQEDPEEEDANEDPGEQEPT